MSLNISEGTVQDYEDFINKYSQVLHSNHFHLITAKHSLMQMLGRTEGSLIQDMSQDQVSTVMYLQIKFNRHLNIFLCLCYPFKDLLMTHCSYFKIQSMYSCTLFQLKRKENLCRELIKIFKILDPSMIRLQIYLGVSLFELHMPLLQYGKRDWESGRMSTEQFR